MVSNDSNLWRISRREFFTFFTGLIAAMSFGRMSGTGVGHAAEVKFSEGRCGGEKNMKKRVLVTYASKYGSTGGIADAVGRELCSTSVTNDVALIKNAVNLSSYQGVVIGSVI